MPLINIVDLVFLIPALFFIVRGFHKGIIVELVTVVALILAIIACLKLTHWAMAMLDPYISNSTLLPYLAYIILFLGVFLLIQLVGKFLEHTLKAVRVNILNRILGGIIGFVKIAFLASLIFWLSEKASVLPPELLEKSRSYNTLKGFAPMVIDKITEWLPFLRDLLHQIEQFFEQLIQKSPNGQA